MAEKEPEISAELEEKSSQPINFSMVLMRQADRILTAMTKGEGDFITGVDGLELILAPYIEINKEYGPRIKKINKEAKEEANKLKSGDGSITESSVRALAIARAKLKMRALMLLAGDSGLLPEQRIKYEEPE